MIEGTITVGGDEVTITGTINLTPVDAPSLEIEPYPVYANNTSALANNASLNSLYRDSEGIVRQVFEQVLMTEARFIMLGDSITQDVFSDTATMKSKVETAYPNTLVTFFEEGTDGIRATQVDDQIASILDNYPSVAEPTYVVVTLGTNDISPIRPYSSATQASLDAYSTALDDILDEIENRGYIPILNEVYYANYEATMFNNQEEGTLPFNEQIVRPKILQRTPNFAYNDGTSFYQSYNLLYNNRNSWFIDNLHPNATGVTGFQDHFVATIANKIFTGNNPVFIPIDSTDADGDGNPITTDPNDNVVQTAADSFSVQGGEIGVFNILANDDFIPSTDISIIDLGTGNAGGAVSFNNETGEVSYTSLASEIGSIVTIDYRVTYVPTGVNSSNTISISVTGSFDPDAQAYFTAEPSITALEQTAYNDFITGLKSDGLWNEIIGLWSFVNGEESSNRWNIKDPRDLDEAYRITWGGGFTTTEQGMTSTSNGFGNTHLPYNIHGSSDFSFGFYSGTNVTSSAGYEMGSNSFGQTVRLDLVESGNHQFLLQGATASAPSSSTVGMFIGSRTATNSTSIYKNGVLVNENTTDINPTASGLATYLFCINNNNNPFNFSQNQGKISFIANGLNATQAQQITDRIETLLDALGKGSVN